MNASRRSSTLTADDTNLWELCYYAGLTMDPQVFKMITDLLQNDFHPKAILDVLTAMAKHSKYSSKASKSNDNVESADLIGLCGPPSSKQQIKVKTTENKGSHQKTQHKRNPDTMADKKVNNPKTQHSKDPELKKNELPLTSADKKGSGKSAETNKPSKSGSLSSSADKKTLEKSAANTKSSQRDASRPDSSKSGRPRSKQELK